MDDEEISIGYFQQDGATSHTSQASMAEIQSSFGDRVILKGLWGTKHKQHYKVPYTEVCAEVATNSLPLTKHHTPLNCQYLTASRHSVMLLY
jgi:hypothetical protein